LPKLIEFAELIHDINVPYKVLEEIKVNSLVPYQKRLFSSASNDLGLYLLSHGKTQEALKVLMRSLEVDSREPVTYSNLGYAMLVKTKDINKAIEYYNKALKIDPNMFEAHYNLGYAYFSVNCIGDAIYHYKKAKEINKDDQTATRNLDIAIKKKKETEIKIDRLKNELKQSQDNIKMLYEIAVLCTYTGDYNSSLIYLNKIAGITPEDPDIYYNIACIYARKDNKDDSLRYLDLAINKGFHNWSLLKTDKDLYNIRGTKYYMECIDKY